MAYQFIQTDLVDQKATIILNREPLNVLNIAMMKEINQVLENWVREKVKVIIFKALGKAFSAGVDVGEHLGDQAQEMIEVFHGMFRRLERLPAVSLAVVQGAALGGGCELALYCDLVVASEKARFGQPEIQVGVFPPIAALLFPRIMGRKKALELILTGDTLTAAQALSLGLINQVVPPETLEAESDKLCTKLLGLSRPVLALTKKAFYAGLAEDREAALQVIETIYLRELMKTHDAEEGLKAFLEKRQPMWRDE